MAAEPSVTYSGDTAFHDLGLPDADELVLRADLMRKITELARARHLTPVQMAEVMHMDQQLVSALLDGRIGEFSLDRLLQAVSELGQDVEVRIKPAATGKGRLHLAA